MIWIILIPAAVFLVTLWRREYGIAITLVALPAYLLRTKIAGVPTTALELSIYALVVAFLITAIRRRRIDWPKLPRFMMAALLVWCVSWALATMFSTDRGASLGALKAWLIDPLLFGFILLSSLRTIEQRRAVLLGLMASGIIVALAGLAQLVWFRETLQDNRLSSFFAPVANYAAMFIAPILVLTIGALLWKLIDRRWWIAAGLMLIALALTVSFGGYLSLGVGLIFLWCFLPNKVLKRRLLIGGVAMVIFGGVLLSTTPYLKEKLNFSDRSSGLVRTQIWRTSVEMIKDRPWFGVGPNAYEPIYRATIPKLYWPPLEWLVSQPHQLFLALWLETGLLGLLTFIIFIVWWVKNTRRLIRTGDAVALVSIAVMAAIIIHGLVDTPLFKNDLMLIFVVVSLLPFLSTQEVFVKK